ncbi:hypothetical protein SCARD494_08917 [Seiridium cardinale]
MASLIRRTPFLLAVISAVSAYPAMRDSLVCTEIRLRVPWVQPLPSHRYYKTAHERLIKDECGYTGRMPYTEPLSSKLSLDSCPGYWDETADNGKMLDPGMWSDEFFGCNGTGEVSNGPHGSGHDGVGDEPPDVKPW